MPISAAPAGIGAEREEPAAGLGTAEQKAGDAKDDRGDDHDQRHTHHLGAGEVQPRLRHLVGADLPAAGPEAVEPAKDRHGAEGDDDRRHLPEGDDRTVHQPAGEPDGAAGGEAGGDPERRVVGHVSAEP